MRRETLRAINQIDSFTAGELDAIRRRARVLQVGGGRWEEAWLAARAGHAAGIAAQARAVQAGASPMAAAAIAGAIAAFEAGDRLSTEQFAALTDPVATIISLPSRPVPVTPASRVRRWGACPVFRYG